MKYWNWIKSQHPSILNLLWKRGRKGLPMLCQHRHSSILNLLWKQWICAFGLHFWCYVCAFTFSFIYLSRSVFYVRFYLSVGLVHGTHYLFDSKIFTRMCLSVGPQRLRFASFFIFGVAFVRLRFPFFFFFNLFIKKCVLREILSVSGSCAWNLLSLW